MKSKAHLKGHPIHPMLIAFPIAFFTGTLIFDLLGFINNRGDFLQTGKYLEIGGIIMSIIAAVPGLIDFIYTVPPRSSGKNRAAKHGILNVSMLVLFLIAALYRDSINFVFILIIEALGMALLTVAGWLGGTLAYRNQIGVDPRYADAGKWKEAYFKNVPGTMEVAVSDELKINQMKLLHIGEKRIVLARCETGYVAFDDRCTHKGGSLAGGAMICGTVQCPWHGSQFDVTRGEIKAGPAKEKINVYVLNEQDGKVYINL
jgi:uncharacterized membrane protein/nitrite reductase/ring-hydroxylating ferredoxin subunit